MTHESVSTGCPADIHTAGRFPVFQQVRFGVKRALFVALFEASQPNIKRQIHTVSLSFHPTSDCVPDMRAVNGIAGYTLARSGRRGRYQMINNDSQFIQILRGVGFGSPTTDVC